MIFVQKLLAPGPGTKSRATFRWRPFQSALSGSLFFIPPALPEVMIPWNNWIPASVGMTGKGVSRFYTSLSGLLFFIGMVRILNLFRSGGKGIDPWRPAEAEGGKEKTHEDHSSGHPTATVPSQIPWF